jgi:hypothetical protein
MARIFRIILIIYGPLILVSGDIRAQDMEARSYAVVPTNLHALAFSYTFSKGNVITEGASPVQDLKVTNNVLNLGYVQTFALFNKLTRVAVSLPYGFLNGSAKVLGVDTTGSRTGFYDGRIKIGMNLFGSPVLSPANFIRFQEHTVMGISLVISVPVGQYLPSKLINLGSNRWGFKPEIGASHREGRLFYEAYAGIWLYTNNNEYFQKTSLSQKSVYSLQAHVDYTFKHGKYVALNGGFAEGGETYINNIDQNNSLQNWRIGGTFSTPVFNKHQSIKAMINTGIATRAGQNYTAITLVYQYSWF